jgi:hypothetical protein
VLGVYTVTESGTVYSDGAVSQPLIALCNEGDFVLSGGFAMTGVKGDPWISSIKIASSQPKSDGSGWEVTIVNNTPFMTGVPLTVTAICAPR